MGLEKNLRIVIPHSWSPSVGDMAVLVSTARMLRRTFPGSNVTALVSHPEFTKKRCPSLDADLERWPWPIPGQRGASVLEKAGWPFILLGHYISSLVFRFTKKKVFLFNGRYAGPLNEFFRSDIVLSPGGDFISPRYGFFSTFNEFIIAKMLGKRLVICAQTIGPFEGLLNRHVARFALGLADLIIVRERKTADMLEGIGIRKHRLTADIVFTLPTRSKEVREKRVLICPERMGSRREQYISFFREMTRRITEEMGFHVTYFPANSADIRFQEEIISGLDCDVDSLKDVRSPEEIAEMASDSEFIISSRMHPIVLGTLSSTPFFSIGDSFKFEHVLGAFYGRGTLRISELEDLRNIERVIGMMKERDRLRARIMERMPEVRERSLMTERILKDEVSGWGLV